jgi:hypothetical protein
VAKNLAIACIGYINCRNIRLVQKGNTDISANRKRAKKGKRILEPYYVCEIQGVRYDSVGRETGRHVSFRFDVRGFYRRLRSGQTVWVRPHQRGLAHDRYLPKDYKVDD